MIQSKRWIERHLSDPYVKKANQEGYPSRAAYKLLEMQEKDRFITPGMNIVDLGAAPGGWSMVAKQLVGRKGQVFALDCLPMKPIEGVCFIQGDFNDADVLAELLTRIDELPIDVVMSDMAPNITGMNIIDQPRSIHLVELALESAKQILKPGGTFLAKVFQGPDIDKLIAEIKKQFRQVKIRKPKASRSKSREVYVLARGFRLRK